MRKTLKINGLQVRFRRSDRRSIAITVERNGGIAVSAPKEASIADIEKFVLDKQIWIHQKLARKKELNREKPIREFVSGQGFLYLGKSYRLKLIKDNSRPVLQLRQGYFELLENHKQIARQHFISWYKHKTEYKLTERLPRYDKRIGVRVEKIRISDLGNRWASYSRNGTVSFNWRSVMAPIWVFDYILVHELTHMIERPHSKKFWQMIARVIPDYEEQVRWLAENGPDLDL